MNFKPALELLWGIQSQFSLNKKQSARIAQLILQIFQLLFHVAVQLERDIKLVSLKNKTVTTLRHVFMRIMFCKHREGNF